MITIGIPTYERMRYIESAIGGCLTQTYEDYEIIVGDSSRHDNIRDFVQGCPSSKIRYVRYDPAIEITTKLNHLLREGKGEWMLILCDDDFLDAHYLEAMAAKIKAHPDASLYRSRYRLIDEKGETIRLDRNTKPIMSAAEFLSRVFLPEKQFFKMNISGILFPRELFIRLGGFPLLEIPWHTERIAWATLAAESYCVFEPASLCSIRLHADSMTSGFKWDPFSSIESDMTAEVLFEGIIQKVFMRAHTTEDYSLLEQAKIRLRKYMRRHLSRSIDRGIFSCLANPEGGNRQSLQLLFEKMKELQIQPFPSFFLYRFLCHLPQRLREPVLGLFQSYKTVKWCR